MSLAFGFGTLAGRQPSQAGSLTSGFTFGRRRRAVRL
jgi:hypothetical protein